MPLLLFVALVGATVGGMILFHFSNFFVPRFYAQQ
jgi:Mn2+/Fe2+ NRAMP family transporter